MKLLIRAGKFEEIIRPNGIWLVLDIGFSNEKRSCGLLENDGTFHNLRFDEAQERIKIIACNTMILNLMIEAPLSVAFDKLHNPKARKIERINNQTRYWYYGPGCTVMVAALYLLKTLVNIDSDHEIRLFEGFVSYKEKEANTNHEKDVKLLWEVIQNPTVFGDCIVRSDSLKVDTTDEIIGAFEVAGLNILGIPPVIKR